MRHLYNSSIFHRASVLFLAVFVLVVFSKGILHAADGDTIRVHTIEFGDAGNKQAGTFKFPSKDVRYQKVLMNYKLRCPQGKPCGEWDYLMYVFLYHPSGRMDSTLMPGPNFTFNGSTAATLSYLNNPAWNYTPRVEHYTTRTATQREGTTNSGGQTITPIGSATTSSILPFSMQYTGGKTQFLWRKTELDAANILPGDITALRLNILKTGSGANRLTIRMKNTSTTQLSTAAAEYTNFTTVYERNTSLTQTGWMSIPFTNNFTWDGSSSILVEISQNNIVAGQNTSVAATNTSFTSGVYQYNPDSYAKFDGTDYLISKNKITLQTGTVEARFNAADVSGQHYILSNDRDAGTDYPGYHLYLNGNKLYGAIWRQSDKAIMTVSGGTIVPGRWYHAAMSFDGTDLVLYLDGQEIGRTKTTQTTIMAPAYNLMIGVLAYQAPNFYPFKGGIDEVRIWNIPLSQSSISTWQYRQVDNTHPQYSNLVAYFPMNDGTGFRATETITGNHAYFAANKGNWNLFDGSSVTLNQGSTSLRPNVLFEQGLYTAHTDSVVVVDSTIKDPIYIIEYSDVKHPGDATDTLVKWLPYYRYTFNANGTVKDSTFIPGEMALNLSYHSYYGKPFEVIDKYELMRYITPYGNGLDLGSGFTWTMDISDYAPLLRDSVQLEAYNQQEDLELTFDIITGTPPRDVLKIEPLWLGNFPYGQTPSIETYLMPKKTTIPAAAKSAKMRIIQTGHGFGAEPENCAEFCDKQHFIKVNGIQRFSSHIWRNTCGLNPVYPQGGTWLYNRSNWCPGAEVQPYDYEVTPYITPGSEAELDVDMEAYTYPGGGTQPYYSFSGILCSYSASNFTLDASLERILAPTKEDLYRRQNPVCGSSVIVIKNTGSTPLTSLDIEYGVKGATPSVYTWTGTLNFMETQQVTLPPLNIDGASGEQVFQVKLARPNGGQDQYAANNTGSTTFDLTPVYYHDMEVHLRTNNDAKNQYEWTLKNSAGTVIASRANMDDNKTYIDSLHLEDGCYEFRLINKEGIGLDFWAMRAQYGSGALSFTSHGKTIVNFKPDFGSETYQQFRISPKPAIQVSRDTLNFGTTDAGKPVQLTVDIMPQNKMGLHVDSLSIFSITKAYTVVSTTPPIPVGGLSLAEGEKITATVQFNPPTAGKTHSGTLTVRSNDDLSPGYVIPLRGVSAAVSGVGDYEEVRLKPALYLTALPNRFADETHISYAVDAIAPTHARITIVNVMGQEMVVLLDGMAGTQVQNLTLSAAALPSGIYYLVMRAAGSSAMVPLTVVK